MSLLGLVQRPDVFKVKMFLSIFCKLCSCCVTTYTFVFQGKKFASASQNLLFSVSVNSYFAVIVLFMHYDIFVTG